MSPAKHLLSGIVLGGVILAAAKDPGAAALGGGVTVACDFDHVLEYGIHCAKEHKKPTLAGFFSGSYFQEKGTVVVCFHAYEYAALLLAAFICSLIFLPSAGLYLGAAFAGYALHLVLDLLGNDFGIAGYSLLYRMIVGFKEEKLCKKYKV